MQYFIMLLFILTTMPEIDNYTCCYNQNFLWVVEILLCRINEDAVN